MLLAGTLRETLKDGLQRYIQRPIIIGGGIVGLTVAASFVQMRRREDRNGLDKPILLESAASPGHLPGRGTTTRFYEPVCRSLWTSLNMPDDMIETSAFFMPRWLHGRTGSPLLRPFKELTFEHRCISLRHEQLTDLLIKNILQWEHALPEGYGDDNNNDDGDGGGQRGAKRRVQEPEPPILHFGKTAVSISHDDDETVTVTCHDGTVVHGDIAIVCCGSGQLDNGAGRRLAHPLLDQSRGQQRRALEIHGVSYVPPSWGAPTVPALDVLHPNGSRFAAFPSSFPSGFLNWRFSLPAGKGLQSPLAALPVADILEQAKKDYVSFVGDVLDFAFPTSIVTRAVPVRPTLAKQWFRPNVTIAGGAVGSLGAADCFDLEANLAIEDAMELAASISNFNININLDGSRALCRHKPVFAAEMYRARRYARHKKVRQTLRWFKPSTRSFFNFNRFRSSDKLAKRIVDQFAPPVFYFEGFYSSDEEEEEEDDEAEIEEQTQGETSLHHHQQQTPEQQEEEQVQPTSNSTSTSTSTQDARRNNL